MNYECSSSGNDVNSLTTGEIAGVAVGAFVGAAIIIAVIFFIWTRCISSGHQDLTALK